MSTARERRAQGLRVVASLVAFFVVWELGARVFHTPEYILPAPHDDRKRVDWMSLKDWEDTVRLMKEYMELKTDLAPATVYTNTYLPY